MAESAAPKLEVAYPKLGALSKYLSTKMFNLLAEQGQVHILNVNSQGGSDFSAMYLVDGSGSWLNHPLASQISASCTRNGLEWFKGASACRPCTLAVSGKQLSLSGGALFHNPDVNSNVPAASAAFMEAAMTAVGWRHVDVRNLVVAASAGYTPAAGEDAVNYAKGEWLTLAALSKALVMKLGYGVLPDVPVRCVSELIPASIVGNNPPVYVAARHKVDNIARAGIKYFIIPVSTSAVVTTTLNVLVPIKDDRKGHSPMIWIPNSMTGAMYGLTSLPIPHRSAYASRHGGFDAGRWLDVPDHYKTDIFGRVAVAADFANEVYTPDIPIPVSLCKKMETSGVLSLLPILAPLGEATYYVRGSMDAVEIQDQEKLVSFVNEATGTPFERSVRVTTINVRVDDILTAIPQNWYQQYVSSGFGFFKGKGVEAADKAAADMKDLAGLIHTAYFPASPVLVPTDIVTRLDIYRDYKKAKEKACLTNDFMKLQFNAEKTWGQVNDECNKQSSLPVVYGFSSGTPSITITEPAALCAPPVGLAYTVNASTLVWTVTAQVGSNTPTTVSEGGRLEMWENIAKGAPITNSTAEAIATNWKLDQSIMLAERNDGRTVAARLAASAGQIGSRGRGGAPSDFAWENMGISGFPVVRALSLNDGMKAIINSVSVIGNKTANLHAAYLKFAKRASIAMLG